jgi:hypothetical protein
VFIVRREESVEKTQPKSDIFGHMRMRNKANNPDIESEVGIDALGGLSFIGNPFIRIFIRIYHNYDCTSLFLIIREYPAGTSTYGTW